MAAERLCVLCQERLAQEPWRPFCSERCKLEDLARWLDGIYRVPGESVSPADAVSDPEPESDNS